MGKVSDSIRNLVGAKADQQTAPAPEKQVKTEVGPVQEEYQKITPGLLNKPNVKETLAGLAQSVNVPMTESTTNPKKTDDSESLQRNIVIEKPPPFHTPDIKPRGRGR